MPSPSVDRSVEGFKIAFKKLLLRKAALAGLPSFAGL
jgi:hypothetical protein